MTLVFLLISFWDMQVSYMILARVTPVTHSIGNCLKRVIVIVASVIFFQNPMSRQNMLGAPANPLSSCQDGLDRFCKTWLHAKL